MLVGRGSRSESVSWRRAWCFACWEGVSEGQERPVACFDYIPIKYSRSVDPVFSLLDALVSDFR